jgi:FkbM family methyltransferase
MNEKWIESNMARIDLFWDSRSAEVKERILRFRRFCMYISKTVDSPTLVNVGANDGMTGDVCMDIVLSNSDWRVVCIEPVPYVFARLQKNLGMLKRFDLVNVAIGRYEGVQTMYTVKQGANTHDVSIPAWYDQLASFDRGHLERQCDGKLIPFIIEQQVNVKRLDTVLASSRVYNLHVLHIDTEGWDYEVLRTINLQKYGPYVMFVEVKHLEQHANEAMCTLLQDAGYTVIDCGVDVIALRNDVTSQWFAC